MSEKFAIDAATGTGSLTVPIPTSPGRAGFGPDLSLAYDSGAGNGPFGFGWTLGIPAITRKTDKGLPRYLDAAESDVFVISGAEDLVPVLDADGSRQQDDVSAPGFRIHRYRPRIEGLFARIERWTERATGTIHWRSTSRDNILSIYGRDNDSRIFDPADPAPAHPTRVFSWLLCESRDDKGNAIVYEYAAEDDAAVDARQVNERHRVRTANRYVKRITYGNRVSHLVQADFAQAGWLFEVVFDYDERHYAELPLDPNTAPAEQHPRVRASSSGDGEWAVRPDPFSAYRAGFEVRSYRRCRRILMFHRFAELNASHPGNLADATCLVRALDLDYADLDYAQTPAVDDELEHAGSTRFGSFLRSITHHGFVRDDTEPLVEENGISYLTYRRRSLPPLEFEYSTAKVHDDIAELDVESLENIPAGVDGSTYHWIDLDGEGISGILSEQAGTCFYKPNLGAGRFGPLQALTTKPSLFGMTSGGTQLLDLSGDGQLDVVSFAGAVPGFYERTDEQGWDTFRPFRQLPRVRWNDPNLRFVDLDGDGNADILIAEDDVATWYPALAEDGFGPACQVRGAPDEERGPRVVFADGTQSVYLADLSGDGMSDLVRVRNGEVCYWPNLGYGRFGAKVAMDNAPRFDTADQFDQRRIRLADIDGSGTTDIVYLGRDGVRLYLNQSGNRWSEPRRLASFPRVDTLSSITTTDLLGAGTSCLVWSSPLPGEARRALRYVDLMGGRKPHLLTRSVNHLGSETRVDYATSTTFYLADKRAGTPWITRLPFPVQVVERVTTVDGVSGNRFVTRYTYHHGHFDGAEREFRGFGMVEQRDTEEFAGFAAGGVLPPPSNADPASHVPPVLTKTWFHTGVYLGRDHVSDYFAGLLNDDDPGEYYREPGLTDVQARASLLPDTILPPDLMVDEEREACRALKGRMLRQETFALDGTDKSAIPYSVIEQNFTLARLQPRAGNRHAVFFAYARETLNHHYERNPLDPRTAHELTLEVDAFGNVLKALSIGYGRRTPSTDPALSADDRAKQSQLRITYTESAYTENDVSAAAIAGGHHRAPIPADVRTYELTGFAPEAGAARFSLDEWSRNAFERLGDAAEIPYEASPDLTATQRRLIEHVRTLYRTDDLSGFSSLGTVESQAIAGETYQLSLTPSLVAQVFGSRLPDPSAVLEGQGPDQGGYLAWDGAWWRASGRIFFDRAANVENPALTSAAELAAARAHFYVPRKSSDAFNQPTIADYDAYDLLPTATTDALGNAIAAENDYRVLLPKLVTDPNRNRTAVAFDALGTVVATAVMGKPDESLGDELDGFDADPTLAALRGFVSDPRGAAAAMIGRATTRIVYDPERYARAAQPTFAATLAREIHVHDPGGAESAIQIAFSYADGLGREIQRKIQAESGDAPSRTAAIARPNGDIAPGSLALDPQGAPVLASATERWVGSGRTVFNNKGKPVRQYEPFFSSTHLYELEAEMTDTGASSVLFYDPPERVIATLHPNHTYEKVVFDPWRQASYDANDTVLDDPRTDADVAALVDQYFEARPASWQTWHAERIGNALGAAERDAAEQTELHAQTPTVAHLDALGRDVVTVSHNRYVRDGSTVDETYATRVDLDIEGNQRALRDANNRIVVRYDYDLLGARLHHASMDAGERWSLNDAAERPIRAWDSRGFVRRTAYDALRRPVGLFVATNGSERLARRTVYGEGQGDAKNHRARPFEQFDAAGVVTSVAYDFKGNRLENRRDLLPTYAQAVDWSDSPATSGGSFTTATTYDALNRSTTVTSPDGSVYRPRFNRANLLEQVDVALRGAAPAAAFVTNVDYNAKGQREQIAYGNGALTRYDYDPSTYRLTRLTTTRSAADAEASADIFRDPLVVQDLRYTYDPTGNVTRIEDAALNTTVHDGETVEPVSLYTYDAIYRLVDARGREHIAQTAIELTPSDGSYRDVPFTGSRAHPNDLHALRTYREGYEYDAVGNLQALRHRTNGSGWTRRYDYEDVSQIEAGKTSNRLTRSTLGNGLDHVEPLTHDAHGNVTSMTHLAAMEWDFDDRLERVDLGGGGTAHYVYDATGQRIRAVIESQNGVRRTKRLYLGGFEIFREYNASGTAVALERESLHVMDDQRRLALCETRTIVNGTTVAAPDTLLRYQLANHLGSASVELDAHAALVSFEEFHPHGTTSFAVGPSGAEVSLKRYRYLGKERDDENGFFYYGARYYAPWLGRWTAADPAKWLDGVNAFLYCRGNPVMHRDPDGRESVLVGSQKTDEPRSTDAATAAKNRASGHGPTTEEGLRKLRRDEDANFANRAENLKTQMEKKKDTFKAPITVVKPETGKELLDALVAASKKGPIKNLVIWGHSGSGGIFMKEDRGFFRGPGDWGADRKKMADKLGRNDSRDLTDLEKLIASGDIKFAEGAVVVFGGCKACGDSNYDPEALAVKFTKVTGITSIASVGGSDQTKVKNDLNREGSLVQWYRFEKSGSDVTKTGLGTAIKPIDLLKPDDPAANKAQKPAAPLPPAQPKSEPAQDAAPMQVSPGASASGTAKAPKWPLPLLFLPLRLMM